MAELRNNTWTLNAWYDEDVAGTAGYSASGELWGTGYNVYGNIGNNDTTSRSSPIQIGSDTTWTGVFGGEYGSYTTLATKIDGTLWSWGRNNYGQCGDNSLTNRSSPVQIPGTDWSQGYKKNGWTSNAYAAHAIRTDGSMWTWGRNLDGAFGTNQAGDNTYYSSPVQVGSDTDWKYVMEGSALKTDGTLWVWGNNNYGGLGQNQAYPALPKVSSPVQIPGTWSDFWDQGEGDNSKRTLGGMRTDGTLWMWGYNGYGQLGQNDVVHYSSPVQLPGTDWQLPFVQTGSSMRACMFCKTDGSVWYTGGGSYPGGAYDQTMQKNNGARSSPVQLLASGQSYDAAAIGWVSNAGWLLNQSGTLYMWGRNSFGWQGSNGATLAPSYGYIPSSNANQWWPHEAGTLRPQNVSCNGYTFWMVAPN